MNKSYKQVGYYEQQGQERSSHMNMMEQSLKNNKSVQQMFVFGQKLQTQNTGKSLKFIQINGTPGSGGLALENKTKIIKNGRDQKKFIF